MNRRLLDDRQRRDWLRLAMSENVGPATFKYLMERFGDAAEALRALPELGRRGGLKRSIRIYSEEDADRDIERAHAFGARYVTWSEPEYPRLLVHIDQAPPLLCLKGRAELLGLPSIAIVGAREASALGRKFTREMAAALGEAGVLVVSGLARGIDAAAHEAAVATGTAAVLAGGLDVIYPPDNERLYADIAERGVLLSEMTPGTVPRAEHFPRRNRIISGMSLGVVVVEAALRSGSLITARLAAEQGREVFAVPGSPLDPRAGGTNKLIRDGATLTTGAGDVLEAIGELNARTKRDGTGFVEPHAPETDAAGSSDVDGALRRQIVSLLGATSVEIDDLIRESGAPAQAVVTVLLELELAGRLERHSRQRVQLAV